MDCNNDGKHDCKDEAFFYNVVVKDEGNKERVKKTKSSQTYTRSSSSVLSGCDAWFLALFILWLFIKLLGG